MLGRNMGNRNTTNRMENDTNIDVNKEIENNSSQNSLGIENKIKVLGLPGWRTNAKILKMQTAALTYNTNMDLVALDAPWEADGPPDQGIAVIYPNHKYYQWYYKNSESNRGLNESLSLLSQTLENSVSGFDGGLGFSQGAGILALFLLNCIESSLIPPIRFAIFIGGVEPPQHSTLSNSSTLIEIPSLHIIGTQDLLKERSERLLNYFNPATRTVMYHNEGHNIPSIRTELYGQIEAWMKTVLNK